MKTLTSYTHPAVMTSAGRHSHLLEALPHDIAGLAAVGHGLLVHEHLASAYGLTLTEAERESVHLRRVELLLERIHAVDDRPLAVAREPAARVAANCRHFTVLLVAALRLQGTPARARCGFGGYFGGDVFEDHWVCEYWDGERWRLVDGQVDELQRTRFKIDFDVTDVPRDRFLVAGEAWARCRAGEADPGRFGLSITKEYGYWWIAANLMRDAAALRNVELLPWDSWGAMPGPDDDIGPDRVALFDRLAELTRSADIALPELEKLYQDDRLRVPPVVHNSARARDEAI